LEAGRDERAVEAILVRQGHLLAVESAAAASLGNPALVERGSEDDGH